MELTPADGAVQDTYTRPTIAATPEEVVDALTPVGTPAIANGETVLARVDPALVPTTF